MSFKRLDKTLKITFYNFVRHLVITYPKIETTLFFTYQNVRFYWTKLLSLIFAPAAQHLTRASSAHLPNGLRNWVWKWPGQRVNTEQWINVEPNSNGSVSSREIYFNCPNPKGGLNLNWRCAGR